MALCFLSLSLFLSVFVLAEGRASEGCNHEHPSPSAPVSTVSNRTLLVHDPRLGPVSRSYRLFVPHGNPPQGGMPLLLGFHGQGMTPTGWAQSHSFDDLADEHHWLVAYPAGMADGIDPGWNCGTAGDNSTCLPTTSGASCHTSCQQLGLCGPCDWSTCYDDVAFVDQIIESLATEFCLNSSAYFLVGESNGGMMMHHLIQERPGKFLAAAPAYALPLVGYLVGSKFQLVAQAAEARRTSIFAFYPRQDTTIPWSGGSDAAGWLYETRDKALGVWAALHGCHLTVTPLQSPYEKGTKNMKCFDYVQCSLGGQVSYCMYDGVHGDWPDQPATDNMIWSFFSAFTSSPMLTSFSGLNLL